MKNLMMIFAVLFMFSSCKEETKAQKSPLANTFAQDITVPEFKALIGKKDHFLLDVRTPEETAQGKIEGAHEIDYKANTFKQKIAELDKDQTYLIYCRSGNRSGKAMKYMSEMGFTKLYNLEGGFLVWPKETE